MIIFLFKDYRIVDNIDECCLLCASVD